MTASATGNPVLAHYGIDHTDVRVPNVSRAHARFTDLGFTVAPPSPYQGLPMATCAIVFDGGGYFAVTGFTEPEETAFAKLPDWIRSRAQAAGYGLGYLSLGTYDAAKCAQALGAAGYVSSPPARNARDVVIEGVTRTVAFNLLMLPESLVPGLSIDFVTEHLTRDTLWRPGAGRHTNGARALSAIVAMHPQPESIAAACAKVFGESSVRRTPSGLDVDGGAVRLQVVTPRGLEEMFPGSKAPADAKPRLVAMVFSVTRVDDCAAFFDGRGAATARAVRGIYLAPTTDAPVILAFETA